MADSIELGNTVDVESLRQTAHLFQTDNCVVELRALGLNGPVVHGFYNDSAILCRDAESLSKMNLKVKAVYVTMNPVVPELLSRSPNKFGPGKTGGSASDADIAARKWLLVDCDPSRPANTNSTETEKASAHTVAEDVRAYLDLLNWPAPVVADSGNGWHLLYPIDLPAADEGLVKGCLDRLADFSTAEVKVDVTVGNASRIVRFYGTMNRKGPHTAERPQRLSRIATLPEQLRVTPRQLLEELAGRRNTEVARPQAIKRARTYAMMIERSIQGNGGSNKLFTVACRMVRDFGLTADEARPIIHEYNKLRCDPPWEDHEIEHKLADAEAAAAKEPHRIGEKLKTSAPAKTPVDVAITGDLSLASVDGRTEIANSRRFLKQNDDRVRYCFAWKQWLVWDGMRWKVDADGAVIRLGKAVMDSLWKEVPKTDASAKVIAFIKSSCGETGIKSMLNLAAPEVAISPDDMDANPWLLNCPNGTVDLRTGHLREHRREDAITKLCPTNYNPDAGSYAWDHFVEGVFQNQPLIEFIQRFFGSCLTGDVREQLMAVFHGNGSNGKSTLLTAVQSVLGPDYSSAAPDSLLMARNFDSHPTENATLHGKRIVVAQETDRGRKLDEARVKRYTGGDRISARKMREDFWDFAPTHKLVLSTNHRPIITGDDDAIWRRLALVPFNQKFWNPDNGESGPEELRQDKELPQKLADEGEGVLAWMVQGCLAWLSGGMQIPNVVRAATSEYRKEQDCLGRFLEERCVKREGAMVRLADLYVAITRWGEENGEDVPDKKSTGQWLDSRGFLSKRGAKGVRFRTGLDLLRVTGDAGDTVSVIAHEKTTLLETYGNSVT